MIVVILTFFFVVIFYTAGTVMGVVTQGGLIDKNQHVLGGGRALITGAVATTIGAILGTSTTTAYAESTSGIAAGGRTDLTAIVTALLFALSSMFVPLLTVVTSAVTVPALVIVGILMMSNVQYIDWNKMELAVPAFLQSS
ncbi:solute carrier family 23 protein [Liquorilactobacillus aquaticus]|nr:solute carrier family 23 protein [Liquorilactobacillus aquaticus]